MEYSERIDQQIAELLRTRGRVRGDMIPGIPDEQGALLLARYGAVHGMQWDGTWLSAWPTPASESLPPGSAAVAGPPAASPVDQVLAMPIAKSMLDSEPAGAPVAKLMWLLPLSFALPGGVVAWLLVRNTNKTIGRAMLVVGAIVTVLTIASGLILGDVLDQMTASVLPR